MRRFFLTLLLLCSSVVVSGQSSAMVMDGELDESQWESAITIEIELTNGLVVHFRYFVMSGIMYFAAQFADSTIQLDPTENHDYFGIEFDRNGDGTIHGTPASPDDMVLVNYFQEGAEDFYTQSFKVIQDVENSGREDTEGGVQANETHLSFEFSKPLSSGDINGHDISYQEGDAMYIMLAYWNDRPVHDALVSVNKPQGGSIFYELVVGEELNSFTTAVVITAFAIAAIFLRRFLPDKLRL